MRWRLPVRSQHSTKKMITMQNILPCWFINAVLCVEDFQARNVFYERKCTGPAFFLIDIALLNLKAITARPSYIKSAFHWPWRTIDEFWCWLNVKMLINKMRVSSHFHIESVLYNWTTTLLANRQGLAFACLLTWKVRRGPAVRVLFCLVFARTSQVY